MNLLNIYPLQMWAILIAVIVIIIIIIISKYQAYGVVKCILLHVITLQIEITDLPQIVDCYVLYVDLVCI